MLCDECFELRLAYALATRRLGRFAEHPKVARDTQYQQQEELLERSAADANIAFEQHKNAAHKRQDLSGL
jgi:hypothetical protein